MMYSVTVTLKNFSNKITADVGILALSLDTWQKMTSGLCGVDMWHFVKVTSVTLYGCPKNISKMEIK